MQGPRLSESQFYFVFDVHGDSMLGVQSLGRDRGLEFRIGLRGWDEAFRIGNHEFRTWAAIDQGDEIIE